MVGRRLISINIPCYRQLDLAKQAVASILAQTLQDFDVTLLDDGASDDYREYVESLRDPRVRYQRNPTRLGAMENMFAAIRAGSAKYTMAFHEDDVLGREYLAAAVELLEKHPRYGFVACELHEFAEEPLVQALETPWDHQSYDEIPTAADYVRAIIRGRNPMFGSIVYRRAALEGVQPQHDRYATLVDRPFLLDILERWSAAIIRLPLAWYRRHSAGDARHTPMTTDHVLRLFERYRVALGTLTPEDAKAFFNHTRYWLFELHRLTPPANRAPLIPLLYRAWTRGIYRPSLGDRHRLRALGNQ